jgi:ABC-2 type transport system permease protein
MKNIIVKEINAAAAIAGRELLRFIKNPLFLILNLTFPVIFIGLFGGGISQNLSAGLPYDVMKFVLLGMAAALLYQSAMSGVISLMEDRETDFTQEIFVAPISRYTIIIGKVFGAMLISLVSLVSIFLVAIVMRISLTWADVGHILVVAPLIALSGAALGVFFIGLVNDPKTVGMSSFLLIFPQFFICGAIIPVIHSSGILKFLASIFPMTYVIDLMRGVFYHGKPVYNAIVVHSPWFNLVVTLTFGLFFVVVGTLLFARSERNK